MAGRRISNTELLRLFAEQDTVNVEVADDGTRAVTRGAEQYVRIRPKGLPALGLADVVQPDGTIQLDTAGQHRYRPIRELPHGSMAYERIEDQPGPAARGRERASDPAST